MVLVSDLKYGLWGCLCFFLACSSEDIVFQDFMFGEFGFVMLVYFIDVMFIIFGVLVIIEYIELYVDFDLDMFEGCNEFWVIESGVIIEVYFVFFNDSIFIDINFQDEVVFNNVDLFYGLASYWGVGFCFYLLVLDVFFFLIFELEDLLQFG